MKIKFVYGIFPAFIFYTDSIKKFKAGVAYFMFIKIKKKYQYDVGLLNHEILHVKQLYKLLIIFHVILYRFNERYRYKCELEAYRVQLNSYDDSQIDRIKTIDLFAKAIMSKYNLDVSEDEIRIDLLS